MSKKKTLAVAIAVVAALIVLTGCVTKEEKQKLRKTESLAEQYLEDKYSEDFKLSDSGYHMASSVFSYATSNMWFEFTDGTTVYYDAEGENGEPIFYDDKQSEEISNAIIDEVLSPLFDEMGDVRIGVSDKRIESAFKFGNYYKEYSFYHEYYDGDIKSYLSKEETVVSSAETIYLVCNEDAWQASFQTYKLQRAKYYSVKGYSNILAVTEEGYRNKVSNYYEDGAFAELRWYDDAKIDLYVQKYIEAAENIYICADDDEGFTLEDGDIVFVSVDGFGEFAGKKAYKAVFSDRVKAKCDDKGAYTCYIKAADGSDVNENKEILHKYVPEYEESYSITEKSDLVREDIREDYIYWFGVREPLSSTAGSDAEN